MNTISRLQYFKHVDRTDTSATGEWLPDSSSVRTDATGWPMQRLVALWFHEIEELVSGRRDRCCIVESLLAGPDGGVYPATWWALYRIAGEIRVQRQTCIEHPAAHDCASLPPGEWWNIVPDYSPWIDCDFQTQIPAVEWMTSDLNMQKWMRRMTCAEAGTSPAGLDDSFRDHPFRV